MRVRGQITQPLELTFKSVLLLEGFHHYILTSTYSVQIGNIQHARKHSVSLKKRENRFFLTLFWGVSPETSLLELVDTDSAMFVQSKKKV